MIPIPDADQDEAAGPGTTRGPRPDAPPSPDPARDPGPEGETPSDGLPETAVAMARAIREGRVTAEAVVRRSLERIRERDGALNAFVALRAEEALEEARALRDRAGWRELPLAGVPVAIKDVLDVAGLPTALGSEALRAAVAESDAEPVARLRAAGAIVVGKTACPELSIWATTDVPGRITRNPVAPDRTPGGSSGGSAAAVAAGMVPLALGTDGLGSIRIPAAACGVVGLKPGQGSAPVGIRGGDWHGMAVTGPLARTTADVALATAVLADHETLAEADVARPLLVAISTRSPLPMSTVDREWEATAREVGRRLKEAGHHVVEDDPGYSPLYALPVFARWFGGVAAAVDGAEGSVDEGSLERRARTHVRLGRWVHRLGGPWEDGLAEQWRRAAGEFLESYDILITPALAHPPLPAAPWARRGWLRNVNANARYAPFAASWNLAGTPAGVVPTGRHRDGTPLAVQVVGPRGKEGRVLAMMRGIERAVRTSRSPAGPR